MSKHKYKFLILVIIIFFLLIFSTIFALLNITNTGILKGITVNGVDVSGLDASTAYQTLYDFFNKQKSKNIIVKYQDYETTISLKQLEVSYDIQDAVNSAYGVGRSKNIVLNNYDILCTKLFKKNFSSDITWNTSELDNIVSDIATKLPGKVVQPSYYIEDNQLIISSGVSGLSIDTNLLKEQISTAINNQILGMDVPTVELEVISETPKSIDLDKIYQEIYKEPKDAYLKNDKVYPEVNGMDFSLSLEEAKSLLTEDKSEYIIPLKITTPSVTIQDFGDKAFTDRLSRYTTRFDESNTNRAININLATNKINEFILLPGEIFSYNKVVGARTIASGYKEAHIYINGTVADGIGGGICQLSSTLYNAVLLANLEIVERRNHYFIASYVPASLDATVSYGSIDFKFKNSRNYPIKIVCNSSNGVCSVEIYGIKEDVEYEVVIESNITETIPFDIKYKDTSSLPIGVENIVVNGSNGYKSEAYKILKLNGKIISKTLLSKDSYHSLAREIERGTKK